MAQVPRCPAEVCCPDLLADLLQLGWAVAETSLPQQPKDDLVARQSETSVFCKILNGSPDSINERHILIDGNILSKFF